MKEAQISIHRRTNSMLDESIVITISDKSSRLQVTEIEMDLKDFALAITGLGACKALFNSTPSQFLIDNIGKKREIKSILIDKPFSYDSENRRIEINKSIKESGELKDGWMLFSDGTRSQQHGKKHKVILYRFVGE